MGQPVFDAIANGAGAQVANTKHFHGALENVDVGKFGMGHLTIDKSEIMQRKVISAIDAVALRSPNTSSIAQQTEARATRPSPANAPR
jgi:hypothetical protein